MEGPSLFLAAEQLQPFAGRRIERVAGNSRIGIERLAGQNVAEIFAWGKHLLFQFDRFALRVHFMLWGTFAATVEGRSVTGDYRRSGAPRLVLTFPNGDITMWAASVRFVEDAHAKAAYDFAANVMADEWDGRAAAAKVRAFPRAEIADVLLDQAIFALMIRRNDVFNTVTSVFYFILLFASSMFYPVEPLPTPLRQLSWANPITWHVDVLRYATIGVGQPSIVRLEAIAFLIFTAAAFAGALWALKRQ